MVKEKDSVSLDITHGLRHLPLFVVLVALYLKAIKQAEIKGIYYGASEMREKNEGVAPVVDLTGLLAVADWISALSSFDKDGDYGVFANLLTTDGFNEKDTKNLTNAAFAERTQNIQDAVGRLGKIDSKLSQLHGVAALFSPQLRERISWYSLGKDIDSSDELREIKQFYQKQKKLAYDYFERRDYIRATTFALETLITRQMRAGERPEVYEDRERVTADKRLKDKAEISDMLTLNTIRNALAHGSFFKEDVVNKKEEERIRSVKGLLESEDRLARRLKTLMDNLLIDM